MVPDHELLRKFAEDGAQEALAEVVRRKVDFVYAVAMRQVAGDAHLAEEVTQAVFMVLARDAARLARHEVLTGWLFTTARFAASKAVRTHQRWKRREQEANAMNLAQHATAEPSWERLRPVIDEVLGELSEADRTAILLRYFDGCSLAAVGTALGLEENSARMRVNRALGKLADRLAKRGITSTVAALGVALASQPPILAPAGLAVSSTAAGVSAAAGGGLSLMNIITWMAGTVAAAAVGVGGTYWTMHGQEQQRLAAAETRSATAVAGLQTELSRLQAEVTRLRAAAATSEAAAPLAELRALAHAAQQKLIPANVSLLKLTEGQLSPAVVALLALSPEEKGGVERALLELSTQLSRISAANATAQEPRTPGNVTVQVKAFPEAGGKVYDEVIAALRGTLGAERYTALMTIMGPRFEMVVGNGFGAFPRTVRIDQIKGGPPGANMPRYRLVDTVTTAPGVPTTSTVSQVMSRATLERDYPEFIKLLPEDF